MDNPPKSVPWLIIRFQNISSYIKTFESHNNTCNKIEILSSTYVEGNLTKLGFSNQKNLFKITTQR